MLDVSPLHEQLKAIASERKRLDQLEAGIQELLSVHNGQIPPSSNGAGGETLSNFILEALAKKPMTVDELKPVAKKAGLAFGTRSAGRVLHWKLISMARSGLVEKVNGKWRLKEGKE